MPPILTKCLTITLQFFYKYECFNYKKLTYKALSALLVLITLETRLPFTNIDGEKLNMFLIFFCSYLPQVCCSQNGEETSFGEGIILEYG